MENLPGLKKRSHEMTEDKTPTKKKKPFTKPSDDLKDFIVEDEEEVEKPKKKKKVEM
jgi:hypothetical protein